MKKNTLRIMSLAFAMMFVCFAFCSCAEPGLAERYAKYDSTGERYNLNTLDYISMPEYHGIEIPDIVFNPTEEQISNKRWEKIAYFSEEEILYEGTVQKYDLVDCDYVTTVDGVEYSSMCTSSNSALRSIMIGVNNYDIPEIDEAILGMTPGETKTIEFVFPTPYYRNVMLSGCTGKFEVTLERIRRQNFAEYTDEFVSQFYGSPDTTSYDSNIESQIRSDYSKYLTGYETNIAWDYLYANTKLHKMPHAEYTEIMNDLINSYMADAEKAEMLLDDYIVKELKYENPDDFYSEISAAAQEICKEELMLYTIARCENMTITTAEYEEALIKAAAELETQDLQVCEDYVIKKYGKLSAFKETVLFNKVFDYLGTNSVKISVDEYYANKNSGKYLNVPLEGSAMETKVDAGKIIMIVGICVGAVLLIGVIILAVVAVSIKKAANKKAKEDAELEERRRIRREMNAAKKKHYGKKKTSDNEDNENDKTED